MSGALDVGLHTPEVFAEAGVARGVEGGATLGCATEVAGALGGGDCVVGAAKVVVEVLELGVVDVVDVVDVGRVVVVAPAARGAFEPDPDRMATTTTTATTTVTERANATVRLRVGRVMGR